MVLMFHAMQVSRIAHINCLDISGRGCRYNTIDKETISSSFSYFGNDLFALEKPQLLLGLLKENASRARTTFWMTKLSNFFGYFDEIFTKFFTRFLFFLQKYAQAKDNLVMALNLATMLSEADPDNSILAVSISPWFCLLVYVLLPLYSVMGQRLSTL